MKVQFTQDDLTTSTNLGEGEHLVTIDKLEYGNTKQSNEPLLTVTFKAINGKTTKDYFVLAGKMFKLGSLALAAGFPAEQLKNGGFETGLLQGKPVKILREKTGERVKDGKKYPNFENTYQAASVLDGSQGPSGIASNEDIPF